MGNYRQAGKPSHYVNGHHLPYLSASEVMIHEEALYQVYVVPLPLPQLTY